MWFVSRGPGGDPREAYGSGEVADLPRRGGEPERIREENEVSKVGRSDDRFRDNALTSHHMERRTGKIRGASSRMHRALDGWMLARAPASPAQGLHHHGPRYFNFPYFCTICGHDKLGTVDQNWLERICPICC